MQDNDSLDKIRQQIQASLIQSKQEQLRDEFGMLFDYADPDLSPEAHNEWLDDVLEFERQFENASRITVRERIGNPPIQPSVESCFRLQPSPYSGWDVVQTSLLDDLLTVLS